MANRCHSLLLPRKFASGKRHCSHSQASSVQHSATKQQQENSTTKVSMNSGGNDKSNNGNNNENEQKIMQKFISSIKSVLPIPQQQQQIEHGGFKENIAKLNLKPIN